MNTTPTLAVSGNTIMIGGDFADAVSGNPATNGGATINGRSYSVRSTLGASDTSDALIRVARKEGARMESHWTQAA